MALTDNNLKKDPALSSVTQKVIPEMQVESDLFDNKSIYPDAGSEYQREITLASSDSNFFKRLAQTQAIQKSEETPEDQPQEKTEDESLFDWVKNYASTITPSWIEGAGDVAASVAKDIGKGVALEGGHAIARGVTSGASELLKSVNDFGWWLEEHIPLGTFDTGDFIIGKDDKNALITMSKSIKKSGEAISVDPKTITGDVIQGITQFFTSAGVAGKITKALGLGPGVFKRTIDAFAGAAAGFDPYEKRLSNTIQEASPNIITEFLKADKEDPAVVARLKSGLENGGLGLAAEGIISGLKVLRSYRKSKLPEEKITDPEAPDVRPEQKSQQQAVIIASNDNFKFAQEADKFLSGETVDSPIKVNLSRFSGSDDIKEQIANISRLLPEEAKIPEKLTMQQAEALGIKPEELIQGMEGKLFDRRQIAASWMMFRSAMDELIPLANKARTTGSPEDLAKFNAAFQVTHGILRTTKNQSAEIGRALEIHRRLRQPDKNMAKALQAIIDETGGSNTSMDLASKIATLKNPKDMSKFIDQVGEADTADKVLFAYSNILMSNPATQVVNILDTLSATLWRVPSIYTSSKIGDEVIEGEAKALLFGQVMGMRNGFRYAYKTFKTGKEEFLPSNPIEIPGKQGIAAKDLGAVNDNRRVADYLKMMLPTNLSRTGDQFLKVMNYQGTINQLAYRHVMSELGLEGAEAHKALAKMIDDPPKWLRDKASAQAIEGTFNEKLQGELAPAITRGINALKWGPVPAGRILFATFLRTPINLFRWTIHNTPAAFLSPKIRAEIAAGGAQREMALGRIAVGSMFMGTMASYVLEGKISGAGPKDFKLRQQMKSGTGWQPYSIQYAPGKWVSYNRFATVGGLIGVAADSVELMSGMYTKEKDTIEIDGTPVEDGIATSVVVPFANAVLSKVYMQQFTSFIDALSDPNRYGESYWQKLASSFVPAAVGGLERMIDPEIRRANDYMDSIRAKIPGMSEGLQIRLDIFGREQKDTNGIYNLFMPARFSEAKGSPIDIELGRLSVSIKTAIAEPSKLLSISRQGVRVAYEIEDDKIYNKYVKLAGGADPKTAIRIKMPGISEKVTAFEYLNRLVSGNAGVASERYKSFDDKGKDATIRKTINSYRKAARNQILKENPKISNLLQDKLREKIIKAYQNKGYGDEPRLPTKSDLADQGPQPARVFGIEN